MEGSEFPEN